MRLRVLFISIMLLATVAVTAQDFVVFENELNRRDIPEQYRDQVFLPLGSASYTLLEEPEVVDAYLMLFTQEEVLEQKGDTSCTWKALYKEKPEFIKKYNIPTWAVTYPRKLDLYEYVSTPYTWSPDEIKYSHPNGAMPDDKFCTHCGGEINIPFRVTRWTNRTNFLEDNEWAKKQSK